MTPTYRMTCGVAAIAAIVSFACNRIGGEPAKFEQKRTVYGDENLVPPQPLSVTGCVTASGDRFVLTKLEKATTVAEGDERQGRGPSAPPTTDAYRRVGMTEQLRPVVGQRVVIVGEAEPEKVVDVRELAPPVHPPNATATSGREPQLSTLESAHLAISDLRVYSVNATGERCGAPD